MPNFTARDRDEFHAMGIDLDAPDERGVMEYLYTNLLAAYEKLGVEYSKVLSRRAPGTCRM